MFSHSRRILATAYSMEPRLTRGEYWLLETSVDTYYPMSYLCSERYSEPDGLEQVFNKPGHGLDRSRLIATLAALFRDGLIEALRDDEACFLDESQISDALNEKRPLENLENPAAWTRYRMTPQGAAVWEAFAAPQWDQFILDERVLTLDVHEMHPGSATCISRWRLQQYLESIYLADCEIDADSVDVKECGEWSPTYWKALPSGYQAQFQWRMGTQQAEDRLHSLAFAGFCKMRDGWYRWR